MKKIKISIIAVIAILLGIGGSAFTSIQKNTLNENKTMSVFEFDGNGSLYDRTHWIAAADDPSCPTTLSVAPCRIKGDLDGVNPTVASFNDVLSGSNNFTQEYPAKVTYKP